MVSLQIENIIMSHSYFSESYPPFFLHPNTPYPCSIHQHDEEDYDENVTDTESLPIINFECINEEKEKDKLREACSDWGIFRLVNHGISVDLLDKIHETSKQLFNYSFESKQKMFSSPVTYFWGTPALTTNGVAVQPQSVNWMEGFNIPLTRANKYDAHLDPLPTSFRNLMQEYGNHQSRLAGTIYKAMTDGLDSKNSSYLSLSTGLLRVYRYPAVGGYKQSSWGMDEHTDSSLISIINQDLVGGLQFFKHASWHHVRPIPNTLVVNLGDIIQPVSDDKYKSVKHRVRSSKHKERLSMGYFVFPADDTLIHSSNYKPFTYSDFRAQVQQDIKTVGYKVGLDRFRLPS